MAHRVGCGDGVSGNSPCAVRSDDRRGRGKQAFDVFLRKKISF